MADIDIDPFGEHESRPEEPMNIFLLPQLEEDQLGNWNASKKHRSEEESLKEPNS